MHEFPYEINTDYESNNFNVSRELNANMISNDFDFVNEYNFEDNSDIIDEYYSQNLDYLVLDEIASKPEIYDNLLFAKSEGIIASCTILFLGFEYGFVRSTIAYLSATPKAKSDADSYYNSNFTGANDRKDAFRHVLWSALLAQYYFTISSKTKRINFAKAVTDARESYPFCGTKNEIDSREMDYHNNAIGRELWSSHTTYRKFLWIKIALNRPKTADLLTYAYNKVERENCFILKDHPSGTTFDFNIQEVKGKIESLNDNTVVYFNGPIVPRRYVTQTAYDYSNCNDDVEFSENIHDVNIHANLDDDDSFECPKIITTTIALNACFISKDINFNPY